MMPTASEAPALVEAAGRMMDSMIDRMIDILVPAT